MPLDPHERRAALSFLNELQAASEAAEADEPHVLVFIDPQTGHVGAIGPYQSAYSAELDIDRVVAEIGEPDVLCFTAIISEPPEERA